MITQSKKDTLRQQDALSKNTYFPKHDNQNTLQISPKCKAWVVTLAIGGRISFGAAARLIRWLGVKHA